MKKKREKPNRRKPRTPVRRVLGAPPGDLSAPADSPPPVMEVMVFNETRVELKTVTSVEDLAAFKNCPDVVWIDVNGLGDADLIGRIGQQFGFHRLCMEDVLHIDQRPKYEEYPDYVFVVAQHPLMEEDHAFEQISLFLGRGFVVTFQAYATNRLLGIQRRLLEGKGRVRKAREDYLAYALLDLIVDAYFPFLEMFDVRLDELEESILRNRTADTVQRVFQLRRQILQIRRTLWAMRDSLAQMARQGGGMIRAETLPYFRDIQDHVLRILEVAEMQRELSSSLVELHHSQMNQRMNEIMKVLTMTATIFIPLSFIAGVYGMNFDPNASRWSMPELRWALGYPMSLLLMFLVAAGMLIFFRRKGWLGARNGADERGNGPPSNGV